MPISGNRGGEGRRTVALLSIGELDVFYGRAQALHGVSLEVEAGQIVAVVGPNGAGKSTLLDSIIGLTRRRGRIEFEGRDISRMAPARIVRLGIGYAPERGNLFPFMGVKENLLVGAYRKRDAIEENLRTVFDLFPRLEERQSQETATQSGGERQMASLGRALMSSPRLLMVDEPTLGLGTQGVPGDRRRAQGPQRAAWPHHRDYRAERELRHEPRAGGLFAGDRPHGREADARGAA